MHHSPYILKLQQYQPIDESEQDALLSLVARNPAFPRNADIVRRSSQPVESHVLLDGFAARYRILGDGQRQITSIHIPGDFVDLSGLLAKRLDYGVTALTECRVGSVPHERLLALISARPRLGFLFWKTTLVDEAIHREWQVAMGRRTASQHFAHFLCEYFLRLQAVGLTSGNSYDFPVTQVQVADALGLSAVHVNRTLQELRRLGLVAWEGIRVTIGDWDALAAYAECDPTYLNLPVQRPLDERAEIDWEGDGASMSERNG
jgi:CRP-like cAMP-binding protein